MTEQPPPPGAGPVVVGFDGGTSGEDALALALWFGRVLRVPTVATVVHPSLAAISPARVDAEWIADRHRLAEQILDGARRAVAAGGDEAAPAVEYRVVSLAGVPSGVPATGHLLTGPVVVVPRAG